MSENTSLTGGNSSNNKQSGLGVFFKKNLTIGKHIVMQTLGKAESIEYPEQYEFQNNNFKTYSTHYKEAEKLGKRLVKSSGIVGDEEQTMGETVAKFAESLKQEYMTRKIKDERERELAKSLNNNNSTNSAPFSIEIDTKRLEYNKKKLDHLEHIVEVVDKMGDTMKLVSSLRTELEETLSTYYLGTIHYLSQEVQEGQVVKEKYRETMVNYNLENTKYKTLKEKSNDLVKISKAEKDCEEAKRKAEENYVEIIDEFTYQEEKRDVEYIDALRKMFKAYRKYFVAGAQLMNNLDRFLEKPAEEPSSVRRGETPKLPLKVQSNQQSVTIKPAYKRPPEKKNMFGVPLDKIMARESETGEIPALLDQLINYVEKHGLKIEGIFRLAGDHAEIANLKKEIDGGLTHIDFTGKRDVHVAAGTLKLMLREFPDPLLTYELYPEFLAAAAIKDNEEAKVAKLKQLLAKIPKWNGLLLMRLLELLTKIEALKETNKMTAYNLAVVFGLNMLHPQDWDNPLVIARDSKSINAVCDALITHYKELLPVLLEHRASPRPAKPSSPTSTTTPNPLSSTPTTPSASTPSPASSFKKTLPPPPKKSLPAAPAGAPKRELPQPGARGSVQQLSVDDILLSAPPKQEDMFLKQGGKMPYDELLNDYFNKTPTENNRQSSSFSGSTSTSTNNKQPNIDDFLGNF